MRWGTLFYALDHDGKCGMAALIFSSTKKGKNYIFCREIMASVF
jgi:hypothetical protein